MIAALVVIVIAAAIKHGTLGFGFPLVSTPLVALLADVKTAVLITVVPNIAVNIISILRGGHWRESIGRYWPLAICVAAGTVVGTHFLLVSPPELLQVVLAAMIVVFLAQAKIRQFDWTWLTRRPSVSGAALGVAAGLFSGSVNLGAPPLLIYFITLELTPVAMTQILNLCFIAAKTTQAATLSVVGPGSMPLLAASLPLTALAVAVFLLGTQLQKRMSDALYFKILRASLGTIAILLIGQALIGLAHRFHVG